MYRKLCTISFLFQILVIEHLLTGSNCERKANPGHYVGAVVEYEPIGTPWDSTPDELLHKNCDNYVDLIHEAAAQGADIVVFPEFGLTTIGMPRDRNDAKPFLQFIPEIGYNPCDQASGDILMVVERLSCASKSAGIYVTVNLGEIQSCHSNQTKTDASIQEQENMNDCPEDGVHQYSTTVAFDREGTIKAKYRKYRIYFEDQFESPPKPDITIFETDFGAQFGLITCYDIVFDSPAIKLVAEGVQNIIFPMVWYDQLPFLTAIQAHSMWAAGVKVNLLAAGYHQPSTGQLGSGIFSGMTGPLNYTADPNSGTRIVLAEIPISLPPEGPTISKKFKDCVSQEKHIEEYNPQVYYSFIREDLENYTTAVLDMTSGGNIQVCNNGLCCAAMYTPTVNLTANASLLYRLVAFNGTRKIAQGTHHFAWQVCGILRCLDNTLDSCTDLSDLEEEYVNFESLEITGGPFHVDQIMQPSLNVLDIHYKVIPVSLFELEVISKYYVRILSQSLRNVSIQSTAIIGRIYLSD